MAVASELIQPSSFEYGGTYLLLESEGNGRQPSFTHVKFAAYDPCPAFVIVRTEIGKTRRCPREQLFSGGSLR